MAALHSSYPYYLAGKAVAANADLAVRDKYSGKVATRVALADRKAVDKAIAAAHAARPAMAALPAHARRDILEHCMRRFDERREELALALCIEAGKPIGDARGEVGRLVDTFRIAADAGGLAGGEVLELQIAGRSEGYRGMTRRVPVGACSFITPFNFPLNLVAHKVAPAIAAGCPFVLKPAAKTPVGALLIGEVLAETDLPKGAFSILPCSNEDASALVEDERIALLSFTGGPVGWELKARAGRKKVVLELGGNAACIVDADPGRPLDEVVQRLVTGAYYQSGQSCISVEGRGRQAGDGRSAQGIHLHRADDRRGRRQASRRLDPGGLQGRRAQAGRRPAPRQPAAGLAARGRAAHAGAVPQGGVRAGGAAGALRGLRAGAGLQAGVFTGSLAHAMRAWDALEVGGVVVGDVPSFRVDNMPYGGVKQSGLGREGVRCAIEEMTEPRLLVIRD
jgi:acyl-CoA reductase-like NAD-dependent aldehyde dehydrogenase